MNYYISDLHFGHEKIISLCHRPDNSIEEMNERVVHTINNTVKGNNKIYILGDVACYSFNPVNLLRKIDCEKILIVGNHDSRWMKESSFRHCFSHIENKMIVHDNEYKIFLSHYPMAEWDGYYKGIYQFYGHIHNSETGAAAVMSLYQNAVNVSLDCIQKPRTAKELISYREKTFRPETSVDKIMEKLRVGKYYEGEECR